jgi:DNA-binding beta-propeller fold protein YncE
MDTDELIDTLFIGDSPALMVANEIDKILYVSRMMPGGMGTGSVSTIIHEIDYSDPLKMSTKQEIELGSPAPHGIAINSTGSEVFVTSNTADWLYKLFPHTGERDSVVMDSSFGNYPDNVTQRLKPIQVVSVEDSLLFVTCSAGIWVNPYTGDPDTLSGLVQLWNSYTLTLIDTLQFSWNSSPWHIIQSPVNREVYVVLSGDVLYPGSAGIACLNFESNTLALKWETHSESFETLHGIDVSSDGEQIYVSGRKDGNLHIFNGGTGKLERSIPLGNNPLAGGVQVFSSP